MPHTFRCDSGSDRHTQSMKSPPAHTKEYEMNSIIRKGHLARRTVAALAATFAVLVAVLAFPSTAQASGTSGYGYAKVTDKTAYLALAAYEGIQVLYADEEHATPDGFYYAARATQPGDGARQMQWNYQPYGMSCRGSATKVDWNPWMNVYGCMIDPTLADQVSPGFNNKTAQCQQTTGLPWIISDGYTGCDTLNLDTGGLHVYTDKPTGFVCAPWEDSSLNPDGSARCRTITYDWYTNPQVNSFWVPAPDTCTGMPADSSAGQVYRNPVDYAPKSGNGSCTGNAFAPNCKPGNTHRACTGVVPTAKQYATATVTSTATGQGAAEATATKARKFRALHVVKTASKRVHHKTYTARGAANFYTKATETRTASLTVSDVQRSATVTRTCGADTTQAAQVCAQQMAADDALAVAQADADAAAAAQAQDQARTEAISQAVDAALQSAKAIEVTGDQHKATAHKAARRAQAHLARKIG